MARTRLIKPGFFTNEEIVNLAPETQLLFIGLWTLADREGRLEDRPTRIKMQIFPVQSYDIDVHLATLARTKLITRYKAGGRAYICIPNFKKHQHPHPNEPKSVIPPAKARSARDNVRRTYDKGGSARDKVVSARVLPSFNLSPGFHDNSFLEKKKEEEDLRAHVPRDDPEDPPPPDLFSEEFFDNLQDQKKFRHLDVRDVHQKWKNHCEATGKEPTPEYFLNWLNRERGDLRNAGSDEEIARIVARLS